jgi:hypothetical protein
VERVLANIDASYGDCGVEFRRHSVLLVFGAPCQRNLLAGQEHGRTIPLAEVGQAKMLWCTTRLFNIVVGYVIPQLEGSP